VGPEAHPIGYPGGGAICGCAPPTTFAMAKSLAIFFTTRECGMATFEKGDIVQLKSGGPSMTVDDPKTFDDKVAVRWFACSKMEAAKVDRDSLQPYVDPKK
jgi:uncharacterized protein YodC (DUF2158 family)